MVPFGKQQEVLRDLSASSPEEQSVNCWEAFYRGRRSCDYLVKSRPVFGDLLTDLAGAVTGGVWRTINSGTTALAASTLYTWGYTCTQ